ncbi:MAG: putative prophage CPS-53 integrase [Beijerinckiaceae bacterium]|nr:MAG: putative prophage CPS-53 integrase [Beijerinckiaceae bacterium]
MSRAEKKLSAGAAKGLSKPGRWSDGGGLYLSISADGRSKSWVYLFRWKGNAREMGLGTYPLISLAEARERRDHWRKVQLTGHNPIEARRALPGSMPTFGECATRFITSMSSQWRSEKHKGEWQALEEHAKLLWPMPVNHIDMAAVPAVLNPIWETKRETASRLRGRIEAVLNYAKLTPSGPGRTRQHGVAISPMCCQPAKI